MDRALRVRLQPPGVTTLQVRLSPRKTTSLTWAEISFQPAGSGVCAACSWTSTRAFSGRTISSTCWPLCRAEVGRIARDCCSNCTEALPVTCALRKFELPRKEATKAFGGF
ncbi:hypothetical protein D3C85_1408690 [compost metagenome]